MARHPGIAHHQSRDFFKHSHTGQLAAGNDADIVVLGADPATDVRNFAKVDYTIRAGKAIYKK